MSDRVIAARGLTKDYGGGKGIFGLDLAVNKGEVFGFLGPNGAGKTTTIRLLMGFTRPDKGSAELLGLPCFQQAPAIHRRVGYLPGELALMDDMTGREFIRLMADMRSLKDLGRARELTERFQLDDRGKIRKMSKGTKQKVGLVCAFMAAPELLILDEPTSGLDPLMQREFFAILRERNREGATVFLSSHVLSEIQHNCTRAAIIREGNLLACGSVEELSRTNARRVTLRGTAEIQTLSGIRDCQTTEAGLSFLYSGDMQTLLSCLSGGRVEDVTIAEPDLEEVFLHYYEKEES